MTACHQTHPAYRHGLLVHDTDEELIDGTRAFVTRGLESGGEVLVVGPRARDRMMREALGSHPRLEYGLEEERYQAPMRTLFAYQRQLAEMSEPTQVWVTGTVPLGYDFAEQAAWLRYEAAVDEALSAYPFVAMCTYDTRMCPDSAITAALATHRTVNVDLTDRGNPRYVGPVAFLADPLAHEPKAPAAAPSTTMTIGSMHQLPDARGLIKAEAYGSSLSLPIIERLHLAVHEVTTNALLHGRPPVRLSLWTGAASVTCLVEDSGPGNLDPLTGYRYAVGSNRMGLWAARQLVDNLVIGTAASGGCSVLLTVTDKPLS
jgi:anti-sigma regulatory factor (Ser/Thr protein kinase)